MRGYLKNEEMQVCALFHILGGGKSPIMLK